MILIPYEIKTGEENMRTDLALIDKAIKTGQKEHIFRLYGWKPACLSLGKNQSDYFLDYGFLRKLGIDAVRRFTGGRALLHANEVTYSYICPIDTLKDGENVKESYREISQILIEGFKNLGITLDFGRTKHTPEGHKDYCMLVSAESDLCYNGRKVIGSAQLRKNGYILQHGSILYDYNINLLNRIFGTEINTATITCVKEINPDITKEDIIESLSKLAKQA
ncbi:lipoate--protein ligase family protein [bacterium]|nr:lipoate--protein ligase family protein [bacterium]